MFNLITIKNLRENLHQMPHLEQFWEPGDQDHILDKSVWVGNFNKDMQTQTYSRCFAIGTCIHQFKM